MKKLLSLLFATIVLISCQAQNTKICALPSSTVSTTGDYLIKENSDCSHGTKKITVGAFISDYSIVTSSGSYSVTPIFRGANTYTATTSIKNNAAFKILTASSGSIFSYKFGTSDSAYLRFVNVSSTSLVQLASYHNSVSSSITARTDGNPSASIAGFGALNSSYVLADTNHIKIVSSQPLFPGAEYSADFSTYYGSRSLIDKGYADATYEPTAPSGTFVVTATNGSNVSSVTADDAQYTRNGNVVVVGGTFTATTTLPATQSVINLSIPIGSNFTNYYNLGGSGCDAVNNSLRVVADAGNDNALITFTPPTAGSNVIFSYTYTYLVK